MMRSLRQLLLQKIAITAIFWCLPLLLFPASWFVALGFPAPQPMLFVRLLGAAYIALLVGYSGGVRMIRAGVDPSPIVLMGIASNGLAGLLLAGSGILGSWSAWGLAAKIYLSVSAFGAIFLTYRLARWYRKYRSAV